MAIVEVIGFKSGTVEGFTGTTLSVITSYDSTGYQLRAATSGAAGEVQRVLAATHMTLYLGWWFRSASVTVLGGIGSNSFGVRAGTTHIASFTINSDAKPVLRYGSGVSVVSPPGNLILQSGQDYYAELKVVVGTTGSIELRIGGQVITTVSSVNLGTTPIDRFYVNTIQGIAMDINHLILDSATWVGGTKVAAALVPNGAGNVQNFTPSAGSDHAALVDELPATSTADYVSSATTGHRELFALANPSIAGGYDIRGVQVVAYALETAPDGRTFDTCLRAGSTNYDDGKVHLLQTALTRFPGAIHAVNPNTGVAWLLTDVNSLEAGVKNL